MEYIDYRAEGIIFDIQRFSIHDGPGIRTIAFFKGCPLSCKWCCNPESQEAKPAVLFNADSCVHCVMFGCGKFFSLLWFEHSLQI